MRASALVLPHPPESGEALPQRVLVVENSRAFTGMLREAIETRLEIPVTVASSLAEAQRAIEQDGPWFLALTGLTVSDGDADTIVSFFAEQSIPTVVVSGFYDEKLRQRILGQHVIDYVLKSTPDSVDYLVWLVRRLERNRHIAALVVDDSASARAYAAGLLQLYGYRVLEAEDGHKGLEVLEANPDIRLAIVDQEMPGMEGVEFIRRLRGTRARDRVAVIGLSGNSDASLIPRFLKSGANDFLRKPFSREEFFCRVSQNIDQLELIGTLQDLATRDYLTGLPNRRHFIEQGLRLLPRLQAEQRPVAAAMLDIDHFKRINDTWGHEVGDIALRAVAHAVQDHARASDVIGRFGGEEFVLLSPDLDAEQAGAHFESLRKRISALQIPVAKDILRLTVSVGVFTDVTYRSDLQAMLSEADRRMYLAKADGRNRVEATA
ncbi:MAG: diguanylate cyclase [Pseudoxanthomonas sp.]